MIFIMVIPPSYILLIYKTIFRAESIERFKKKLYDTGWNETIASENFEKSYEMFIQFLIILYDQCFPKKNKSN